ncbi:hypothetical protein [Leisingera sp. F5]|uniref:hypothetical protein n=1 Tax=Leisingera sp. F5 TaxID=1813816 RepID=UPI000B140822|nr:hypothetical protein [Leisingera sp. F5]
MASSRCLTFSKTLGRHEQLLEAGAAFRITLAPAFGAAQESAAVPDPEIHECRDQPSAKAPEWSGHCGYQNISGPHLAVCLLERKQECSQDEGF